MKIVFSFVKQRKEGRDALFAAGGQAAIDEFMASPDKKAVLLKYVGQAKLDAWAHA